MKRYLIWIFSLLAITEAPLIHAELLLNSPVNSKLVARALEPAIPIINRYNTEHAADFSVLGYSGKVKSYPLHSDSNFAWTFNKIGLYSNISAFNPEIVSLDDCKPELDTALPTAHCDWVRYRYSVSSLFLFNAKDLKLESVTRLNITRDTSLLEGLPRFNSIQAMAVAKTVPDAMLITLGYIDSAAPADPREVAPEFNTTLLVRFHSENGKLIVEQDDRCLGNPNRLKTIAAARKALVKCAGTH